MEQKPDSQDSRQEDLLFVLILVLFLLLLRYALVAFHMLPLLIHPCPIQWH